MTYIQIIKKRDGLPPPGSVLSVSKRRAEKLIRQGCARLYTKKITTMVEPRRNAALRHPGARR